MDSSDSLTSTISVHSRFQRKKFFPISEDVRVLLAVPHVNVIQEDATPSSDIEDQENKETGLSETDMLLDEIELIYEEENGPQDNS